MIILNITVKGLEGISKVYMHMPQNEQKKRCVVTDNGEFEGVAE